MAHYLLLLVAFFVSASLCGDDQDFVLETRQLKIPGHPTACNPSIVRWGDAFLLSFNAYTGDGLEPDRMGLIRLDDQFNPVGTAYILNTRDTWQDARLVVMEDRLYSVFNGTAPTGVRRTFVSEVHDDGVELGIDMPRCLLDFPGMNEGLGERNWVPFAYVDTLLMTYSIVPHRILQPLPGTEKCMDYACTSPCLDWQWGTPRAGTTALLDGDHYLAFFHSSKMVSSVQQYFMGAYTFDCRPPFAIQSMSTAPIIGQDFYHGPEYETVRPLLVVFPCGFVCDDQYVWVVYGKQDHEAWVVKLDKKKLYDSLKPIPTRSLQIPTR